MVHPLDRSQDKIDEYQGDWENSNNRTIVTSEFCLLEDIEKEGFIYPDGSLKFELEIKKHNYRKKLGEAEERLKMLE